MPDDFEPVPIPFGWVQIRLGFDGEIQWAWVEPRPSPPAVSQFYSCWRKLNMAPRRAEARSMAGRVKSARDLKRRAQTKITENSETGF